jgi:hypothetical protein
LEAMKRMRNRSLGRTNLFNLSNLNSIASRDKYKMMKKRGRKLIKYLEVIN